MRHLQKQEQHERKNTLAGQTGQQSLAQQPQCNSNSQNHTDNEYDYCQDTSKY